VSDGAGWAGDGESRRAEYDVANAVRVDAGAHGATHGTAVGMPPAGGGAPAGGSGGVPRPGRRAGRILLGAGLVVALGATTIPVPTPGAGGPGSLQLAPAPPDVVRNVLLFAPLGVAWAWLGGRRRTGLAGGALLSLGIEAAQWVIPGRETSPWDVVANAAGVGVGMGFVRHGHTLLIPPAGPAGRRLHRAVTAGVVASIAGGALLFARTLPAVPWFGHLDPSLPHLADWPGEVDAAAVDGHRLVVGELRDAAPVRRALGGDHRIAVDAVAGPPVPRLAALALVTDRESEGVLFVGADGGELVYAVRTWAHRLGFDGGALRMPGALAGTAPGTRLAIVVERRGRDLCAGVNAEPTCGHGFRIGQGWTHWLPASVVPAPVRPFVGWLWLGGLAVLVGHTGAGRRRDPVPWLLAAVGAGVGLGLAPVLPPTSAEIAAVGIGLLGGVLARRPFASTALQPAGTR